jgi:hypothetical protein
MDKRDLRVFHLSFARFATQLADSLDHEKCTVHARHRVGERPAVRIQWQ